MRKILAFFALSLLLPFYAYGTVCTLNNTQDGCISYDGCEYNEPDAWNNVPASCTECRGRYYNSTSLNDTQCHLCRESSFPNTLLDGKEWDPDDESTGNTECPWKCTTGWFVDNNHTSCITCPNNNTAPTSYTNNDDAHIGDCTCNGNTYLIQTTENSTNSYYCGQCGVGVQPNTTGGISTCTCPNGSNRVHGELINGIRMECRCPTGAEWNSSTQQCVCNNNKSLVQNAYGEWVCESCSDSNASLNGNNCVCNQNYYGTTNGLQTSCSKCPAGTTTNDIGATNVSQCQMSSNTQFCDSNGNCINLIPSGANINITQPTNTPTNTPNSPQNYLQ